MPCRQDSARQKPDAGSDHEIPSKRDLDPDFEVKFSSNDPANPKFWPRWRKCLAVFAMTYGAGIVALFSTIYTSAVPGLGAEFGVSKEIGLLGVTSYLVGMAAGALCLAPLSEIYGRRPVFLISTAIFLVLIIPCALATSLITIVVVRFFAGFCGAASMTVSRASVVEVVSDEHRGLAASIWSAGPTNGPVFGPILGGFVFQYLGWRWTNWIVLALQGIAFLLFVCINETYAPAILWKRAVVQRKSTRDPRWWSRYDERVQIKPLLTKSLARPFIMIFTEPIWCVDTVLPASHPRQLTIPSIFWNLYVAIVFSGLFLSFVAYPLAFHEARHWSPGLSGLAFAGIGLGTLSIIPLEPSFRKLIACSRPDRTTGFPPPEAATSIICIAAVSLAAGQIWFAWTCTPDFHWLVPVAAGVPVGLGSAGVITYANNYLAQSYGIYAASALAGNNVLRSLAGAGLTALGPRMYGRLGLHWGGMVLGMVELGCIGIPVAFWMWGDRLRARSTICRQMGGVKP